jgi:hypothetical protein
MYVPARTASLFIFSIFVATTLRAEEAVCLFNGKDLEGWTKRGGAATYAVEDCEIIGRSAPNTENTFLTTDRRNLL